MGVSFLNCPFFQVVYKLIVFSLFFFWVPTYSYGGIFDRNPLIWDSNSMRFIDKTEDGRLLKQSIIRIADSYLTKKPIVVTDKTKSFTDDKHHYCTVGPYWWPDTSSGSLKYVRKDGQICPEYYEYDSGALEDFESRCKYLSVAYNVTGEDKYYEAYMKQLRAWFLDSETYMYPDFEYAQVVPGRNGNRGRSYGLIEAYSFNNIIESIRLINQTKRIDPRIMNDLKEWFRAFARWMMESDLGIEESKTHNNHSIAYDVTLINMLLFEGEIRKARGVANGFSVKVKSQVDVDGAQPFELDRTQPIGYSNMNISHIIDFVLLSKVLNRKYSKQIREMLQKSIVFLETAKNEDVFFNEKKLSLSEGDKQWLNQHVVRFVFLYGEWLAPEERSSQPYKSINTLLLRRRGVNY